jgi:hypothetical protein
MQSLLLSNPRLETLATPGLIVFSFFCFLFLYSLLGLSRRHAFTLSVSVVCLEAVLALLVCYSP